MKVARPVLRGPRHGDVPGLPAKRQAAKAGIGFTALDNGFAAVDDVTALQAICDSLGPAQIESLLRKWLRILPTPFTDEDEAAGYRYELSILQAEFSLTQMLDAPVSGRIFFEQVIRDNLDIGRPDHVALIFHRRILNGRKHKTPGRFRTRVITEGVTPLLHADYKNAKIKQYHKQGRALRTETTINNPHDFGVTKRLTSLPDLRQLGFTANRRLLGVQTISHDPIRGAKAFTDLPHLSSPTPPPASPDCASATTVFTPYSGHCSSTGSCLTDSPTVSCAPSPRPSSANNSRTSPPAR